MVSTHMLNKTSLSKPPKILEKKPFKHLFKVNHRFDKFVVKTICCLLSLSLCKLSVTNYHNRDIDTLIRAYKRNNSGGLYKYYLLLFRKKQINKSLIGIILLK